MVAKIMEFVKERWWDIKSFIVRRQQEIILFAAAVLISLLSFALGYIFSEQSRDYPIRMETSPQQTFTPAP